MSNKKGDEKNVSQKKGKDSKALMPEDVAFLSTLLGDKKKAKRPLLYFVREGLAIPLWAITSVEKSTHWQGSPNTHLVYDIVLNRGRETSQVVPVGERVFSYESEDIRDRDFDAMMLTMNDGIYNVIRIEDKKLKDHEEI